MLPAARLATLAMLLVATALADTARAGKGGSTTCVAPQIWEDPNPGGVQVLVDTGRSLGDAHLGPATRPTIVHMRSCAELLNFTLGSEPCTCQQYLPEFETCASEGIPPNWFVSCRGASGLGCPPENGLALVSCAAGAGTRRSVTFKVTFSAVPGSSSRAVVVYLGLEGADHIDRQQLTFNANTSDLGQCLQPSALQLDPALAPYAVQLSILERTSNQGGWIPPSPLQPPWGTFWEGETENYKLTWDASRRQWKLIPEGSTSATSTATCPRAQ